MDRHSIYFRSVFEKPIRVRLIIYPPGCAALMKHQTASERANLRVYAEVFLSPPV
jgi:hypothetical protein